MKLKQIMKKEFNDIDIGSTKSTRSTRRARRARSALVLAAIIMVAVVWIIVNQIPDSMKISNSSNLSTTPASQGGHEQNGSASNTGVEVRLNLSASWRSNGEYYKQYDIKINNTADTDIIDWTLNVNNTISAGIVQYWNCIAVNEGENIIITPDGNSGRLISRSTSAGIGFTVKSSVDYKLSQCSMKVVRADLIAMRYGRLVEWDTKKDQFNNDFIVVRQ